MKKIERYLVLTAVLGVSAAFVTRPTHFHPMNMDTYSFMNYAYMDTRMYYSIDLTAAGYVKGIDYDCLQPDYVCTFIANPLNSHFDATGYWFYTTDVPQSGIDDSGTFYNDDY